MSSSKIRPELPSVDSAAASIRAAAMETTDLVKQESLLKIARNLESTDRTLAKASMIHEENCRTMERIRVQLDLIRRRNDVHPMIVVLVLMSLFAILWYFAIRH